MVGETRRDNYLESGGTAGTGGEKDATHSVASQGKRERTTTSRRGSTPDTTTVARLEPTRVDAAAVILAAATAAMPLSSGIYWRRGGDSGATDMPKGWRYRPREK